MALLLTYDFFYNTVDILKYIRVEILKYIKQRI